jgi:hypothetical protein
MRKKDFTMRTFILKLPARIQPFFIVGSVILSAFAAARICSLFFDAHQLAANTDVTSAVFQVLGTVYAILLTFVLWGVWQNFNEASNSVQNEAYALLDLVHAVEASPDWKDVNIRSASLNYAQLVIDKDWPTLKNLDNQFINSQEHSHSPCMSVVKVVQNIVPHNPRETAIFSQILSLLNNWLDARRTRFLIARGNSAKAMWPLLITGAIMLFGFHGLFVAKTIGIWRTLLFGLSLVIGLTFYLIFTLDCPFAGSLCIDSEPFMMALNVLKSKKT